jgi:hypothetical protein
MRRVVAALLAATALTACGTGVPTSGPVEQGEVIAAAGGDQFIRVIARPPEPGMGPEDIVRGFQEATASADASYAVARQYLTEPASGLWSPAVGVRVVDAAGLSVTRELDTLTATGVLSATIDSSGEYVVAAPGTALSIAYELVQVDGEWRISVAPDGLVLSPGDIDRGFRTFSLYYFTPDFTQLAPSPVTIPLSDAGLATQLVRGLLAGPPDWFAPAVRTAFPLGTSLAVDSVPIVDGIAEVALSAEVLGADDATRQALSAQVTWTLRQLPGITGVRLTVGGQPLAVAGAGAVQPVDAWSIYDPDGLPVDARAVAVAETGLAWIDADGTLEPLGAVEPSLSAPASALDASAVAGLSADERSLWQVALSGSTVAGPAVRRYTGTALSRPSWDRYGDLWVVDRGVGLVRVTPAGATPMAVADLPEGVRDRDLLAVSITRDGTRAALLVRQGARVEPMVARIGRTGESVQVAAPVRVETALSAAVDLAWQDATTLVVLGTVGASALEVVSITLGSARVGRSGAPEGAVSLAAAPVRPVLVGTPESTFTAVGTSWENLGPLRDPAYPG